MRLLAAVEPLEGRALLVTSALDPSFGTGGLVLGAVDTGPGPTDTGSGPTLSYFCGTTAQADGKILVAGDFSTVTNGQRSYTVAVRRYNADGSVDTSFGTDGQADIPTTTPTQYLFDSPRSIVVQPNGTVDLAFQVTRDTANSRDFFSVVVQLTATGSLDSSFGTSGEFVLPDARDSVTTLAVQGDGTIEALGSRRPATYNSAVGQALVVRLTPSGVLDTTFNVTGELAFGNPNGISANFIAGGIAVTPDGTITVGATQQDVLPTGLPRSYSGLVARIGPTGTLNASFGSGGIATLPSSDNVQISGMVLQAGGGVVVAGANYSMTPTESTPFLIRLLPSGGVDPSFSGVPLAIGATTPVGVHATFAAVAAGADGTITVEGTTDPLGNKQFSRFIVERFTANGVVDAAFGQYGRFAFAVPAPSGYFNPMASASGLTLTPAEKIVIIGTNSANDPDGGPIATRGVLAQLLPGRVSVATTDDFDDDGQSDVAAELAGNAIYAYRKSSGTGDVLQQFGTAGVGNAIPVPGDFDGDGKPDIAVYLPTTGSFAYRPSSGGDDVVQQFGPAGQGSCIPCPGDYFGTGVTAMAVYIPSQGAFAIRGPNGAGNELIPFGVAGAGQSIPAPGDYDGDGVTDPAVYIPSQGVLAYRPSSGGPDVIFGFGSAGPGASIPAPGDYDGDGRTDVAVYIPAQAAFAVHPSSGSANYYIPFGVAGAGQSIPAPGDYDGDGRTDAAVHLPTLGSYAYRPTSGGGDVVQEFGTSGYFATVPVASIPYSFASAPPRGSASARGVGGAVPAAFFPLTADMLDLINGTYAAKKKGSKPL